MTSFLKKFTQPFKKSMPTTTPVPPLSERYKGFCTAIPKRAKKENKDMLEADFIYFDFAVSKILSKETISLPLIDAINTVAEKCCSWIIWSLSGVEVDQGLSERCAAILQRLYFTVESGNQDVWRLETLLPMEAWLAYEEFLTKSPESYRTLPSQELEIRLETKA